MDDKNMNEFDLITRCFAPLAKKFEGSFGLSDDAAVFDIPPGKALVVTKDAINEGVHFIGNEDAALIAQKLLRVNLSDLAAMGAQPLCYFLALSLPKGTGESWVARFAEGLRSDQELYNICLSGGDTTATTGSKSFSLTALGTVEKGRALTRGGAKPGDKIYVSGTIGDSALGLRFKDTPLFARYLLPEPRLALGQKLAGMASACIDVSDGLLQDLGHICKTSHVAATVHRHLVPRSPDAQALLDKDAALWEVILGGGDDYELLFTVPSEKEPALTTLSQDVPVACIGEITAGQQGVTLLDEKNKPLALPSGYRHII